MKNKMNVAEGALVLLGLIILLLAISYKFTGLNILSPAVGTLSNFLQLANTCFLVAILIRLFETKE